MNIKTLLGIFLVMTGCSETRYVFLDEHDRVGCDSGGSSSSGAAMESSSDGGMTDPTQVPEPTATCPTIVNGDVSFCPAGMSTCRTAYVENVGGANGANGTGPLAVYLHGTYETPEGVLPWDPLGQANELRSMVQQQRGLLVLPRADAAAVARTNNPFPWWVVCGQTNPSQCDREDDFLFINEIVACAVDQGLVNPDRLTIGGMSAGGIMTSEVVDRQGYWAGAVSWSGGMPYGADMTPAGDTSVMVLHGGVNDAYCGNGSNGLPMGTCYSFQPPQEALADDVAAVGNFTFLCDHQAGHAASMGVYGTAFMRDSNRSLSAHPWSTYAFGHHVNGTWVNGTGNDWVMNRWCYLPNDSDPLQ